MQLTVSIGHVTIARAAVALETAQDGQNFFARSGDGQVFVAPPIRKVETPGKLKNER
ncbi:hypothetical protein [Novosphingobium sp.]|uniref:hypothetical protein n=1 Tax=Novosphingobium sp. TaxID=1874826 RepID=UPI0035B07669